MKRRSQWFIVCLILFGLSVPSLLISSNTNALKYDITAIPFYSDTIPFGSRTGPELSNDRFTIQWRGHDGDNYYEQHNQFNENNVKAPYYFDSIYNDSSSQCVYNGLWKKAVNSTYLSSSHIFLASFGFSSYRGISSGTISDYPTTIFSYVRCNQTAPFDTVVSPSYGSLDTHSSFDRSSLNNVGTNGSMFPLLPYYYQYSHFFVSRTHVSDSDGYSYDTNLKMSDLFGFTPNKFNLIRIPMGRADSHVIGSLSEGRSIEYRGIFAFHKGNFNGDRWVSVSPTFLQNNSSYAKLTFYGASSLSSSSHQQTYRQIVDCSVRFFQLSDQVVMNYSCPVTLARDYEVAYATFELSSDDSDPKYDYIFDTQVDWSWAGLTVITDNDETPAGVNYNDEPTGNYLQDSANGSTSVVSDEEWYDSLSGLFRFTFINPFLPIFNMFSDNSSCAQIPTISSMIHSQETQVCPFFSSSVRSTTTPVLSLVSMMLVFGFVVHWLGARSGNLFEDSVSTDNYSFTNKFRRNK